MCLRLRDTLILGLSGVPTTLFLIRIWRFFLASLLPIHIHTPLLTSLTNLTSNMFSDIFNSFSFVRFWFSYFADFCCNISNPLFIYTFNGNISVFFYLKFYISFSFNNYWM